MTQGIQSPSRRERRASGLRPGFSLIEILVVMVVLLIGILAVLRLFPGGFLTIQRTSEMTSAAAIIAQMNEQQKTLDSVADSVLPSVIGLSGDPIILRDVLPDDLRDFTRADLTAMGISTNDHPYFLSNCNRFNWIAGETFRLPVPTPNPTTGNFGSVHILTQGPVRNLLKTDALNGPNDTINVYGMPMEATVQSSLVTNDRPDATPVLRNENQYAIDYERRKIAFFPRLTDLARRPPPNNERTFKISYDYYAMVGGNVVRRTSLVGTIDVPDVQAARGGDLRPVWQPIFNDPNDPDMPNDPRGAPLPADFDPNLGIVRDSEEVSRGFRLLTHIAVASSNQAPQWSDDPYEYVWYSDQIKTNPAIPANPGVLLFNPRGYDAFVDTSRGSQPFRVRVDYASFDNHIMREERSVPNQGPYQVRLSLPFIHRTGDILDDQTEYRGMFFWWTDINNANTMLQSPDLLIYNANTGMEIARLENNAVTIHTTLTAPTNGEEAFTLNEKAGTIRFNPEFIESNRLRSATLRICYRAQKDWGVQLQKANSRYILAESPARLNFNHRNYYIGGSITNVGLQTRIYFAQGEAGKTVILGEYFVRTNLRDAQGNLIIKRFNGEAYRINDNTATFEDLPGNRLTWIDLKSLHPEAEAEQWVLTPERTGVALDHVQGASLKTRAIWRDGGRWRKRDYDTLLMQSSRR
jgi:prepilin-type N-terminal cleavage/methylation domain-containing protein